MSKTLTGEAKDHRKERVENHRSRRRWSKTNEGSRLRTLKDEAAFMIAYEHVYGTGP